MRDLRRSTLLLALFVQVCPGVAASPFGQPADIPVPMRYGFDTVAFDAHLAVFRPATQEWLIRQNDGSVRVEQYGEPGDIPVPQDYSDAGHAQLAVFRPSTRQWFIRDPNGQTRVTQFGNPGDIPAPGKYFDRYGKAQLAVYRPSTGEWIVRVDDAGRTLSIPFGSPEGKDLPVPADYLGYSHDQFALFRPGTRQWQILDLRTGGIVIHQFGIEGDRPAPATYLDGLKAQIAVYRPSTGRWYCRLEDGSSPPGKVTLGVVSAGDVAYTRGLTNFSKGGRDFWYGFGGGLGARGFNVAAIDLSFGKGALMLPLANFDIWERSTSQMRMEAFVRYLRDLPNGSLVLLSVADDAGLNEFDSDRTRSGQWLEDGIKELKGLGSREIDKYRYRASWAMIAQKGDGMAIAEGLSPDKQVVLKAEIMLP